MSAQGWRRQREGGGNFPGAAGLFLQKVNYRPAVTVSQCRKGSVEFRFRHELLTRIPYAFCEPPEMAFGIERAIAAVRPVVGAVIMNGGFFDHGSASRTSARVVLIYVVNEQHQRLGIRSADRAWTRATRNLRASGPVSALAHHHEGLAINEFAVLNAPAVALDFQPHLKPEGTAKPVNRSGSVVIEDRSR